MKLFVIIPTYNEKETIGALARAVLALPLAAEVVVVDDNSPDGTGALLDGLKAAETRLHVIHRPRKLGLGTAHLAGLRYAIENGAELAVTMDADFSHDPAYLPALVETARRSDLAIGSRYAAGGGVENSPFHRRLLSRGANLFAKAALGLKVSDCTAGFRCYKVSALKAARLDGIFSNGYSFLIEMLYSHQELGLSVSEIPIRFMDREMGVSKISRDEIFKALCTVMRLALGRVSKASAAFFIEKPVEKENNTGSRPAARQGLPGSHPYLILLAGLFLLPRVLRLVYPYAWFEDPFYLYGAYLVKNGWVPYRDFNHVQLPGAEYLLSALYSLFGTSYRVAEIFTQAVVYANTWLIYLAGRDLCGRTAGLFAAVIFSCSSLVFRYHVWERELLALFLITVVLWLLLRWEKLDSLRSSVLGLIFAAGIFIKLTTVVPLAAALLFIAVVRKEVKNALLTGLSALVFTLLAVSWSFFLAGPGNVFIQAFFSHFVKGVTSDSRLAAMLYPLYTMDLTAVLGILGVFFWKKKFPPAAWYPALVLLVYWAFLTFASPTVWPHNFVYFLPFLSLSGGVFLAALYEMAWIRRKFLAPFSLAAAAILLLATVAPLKNANWVMGSAYGFGYIPRKDVAEISSFIRANSVPADLLLLPQHIAAESGRETVLSETMDTPGLIGWVEEKRKNKAGLREILGMAKFKTYTQMTREVSELGWGSAASLLKQRKLKYVVLTTVPADNCPFPAQYLRSLGYAPARRVGGYEAWSRGEQ